MGEGDSDRAKESIDHMPDHSIIAILAVEAMEAVQGRTALDSFNLLLYLQDGNHTQRYVISAPFHPGVKRSS